MSSEILINSAIGETRLAHMEQGQPVEIRLFRDHEPSLTGAIYYGRVTSLSSEFQAAFIDLGNGLTGFLPLNLLPKRPGGKPKDLTGLLTEGQKIIVQVTADATGDKSVKLTGRIEVVSSALILHPFREGAFISSRIKNPDRREALKSFASTLNLRGMGLTLRTEAQSLTNDEIKKTAQHLIRHWLQAVDNRDRKKVPFLLSQGPESLLQILREFGSTKHDKMIFDRPAALKNAQGWAREFAPDLLSRMELHPGKTPLFEHYGVEEDLDRLFDKKIPLPSGAWITIEQTEAMVTVDVNMGNARLSNDPMKQRLNINFSAAREIFRQIRLRGISGLIVIDFINISGKSIVTNLLAVIDNLIQEDPVQVQRSNLSAFGLLELARKGGPRPLGRQMLAATAPQATIETAALALLRQAERDAAAKPGIPLIVSASPQVTTWLKTQPQLLTAFTRRTGSKLDLKET
ncbi:MAG: ribonuclease E/G [Robiginitomaculum sp.]|nr:ribonuclease E/G [Robiginitomaculum sp.]